MTTLADDLALARELADLADAITLPRFGAVDLAVSTKPDLTPVTEADTAAERAVRDLLAEVRPADAVVGEEYGARGRRRRRGAGSSIRSTGPRTTCAASQCGRR